MGMESSTVLVKSFSLFSLFIRALCVTLGL